MDEALTSFNVSDLEFQPGQLTFKGERFLLINAEALGMLRRDLVSTLGRERAKGFLLRYGWECGYKDASSIKRQYGNASLEFLHRQGTIFHMQEGVVHVQIQNLQVHPEQGKFFMEGIWTNSYEAEQHIQHFGLTEDPVCWTLIGYAGGVSSGLFGRRILYKEITCVGRGDDQCRFVGKTVEDWGNEISKELLYYEASKIGEELEEALLLIQNKNNMLRSIMDIHEQLSRMVLAGQSRQVIIDTIGQMLNSPVIVQDRYFRPLTWWMPPGDDSEVNQYLLSPSREKSPELRIRLRQLIQEKRALELSFDEDPAFRRRTAVPIILGEDVMGYLTVIHVEGTDKELRHMIVERAAAVMGVDLLKERTALDTEHRLKGEFLDDLLSGTTPMEPLVKRAMYMGYDFDLPHRFILIEIGSNKNKDQDHLNRMRNELFTLIRSDLNVSSVKDFLVVDRREGIVLLVNTGLNGLDSVKLARTIQKRQKDLLENITISICISREAVSIEQLRSTYTECIQTLQVMKRLGRNSEIISVEEMSVFDLLYASPAQEQLLKYARQSLDKLLQYDQESGGGTLTQTLHVFLSNECNLQRTARVMSVSLSGLKYRIQRIREIGEMDLENPDQRFNLQLALRILIANGSLKVSESK
ncbi:Sugar diacid utilization regulator [Paenibacillus sp. yr247]|uniref:XylR N-terminal domain-containing protein n=1 Tax=Paenibacillus sp. yr247 TaxID=1761880 RepID=UPI00088DBB63|nr:XylR N-terminal domain-containing protein [Paenibacillus sp. yr247]SDP16765.1 Sugar diacid utilization regulator [Paenibacillus sp. yr247]